MPGGIILNPKNNILSWIPQIYILQVIHLKCPKRQALRRVKDAFNPPTKFAM